LPDSYEIHLMLDSDLVLNKNHLLKQEILNTFQADDDYKTFSLAYYETLEQDFFEEGWINRIRLKYEETAAARKQTMDSLLDMGILLKVDSLKTQQMLDAYLVSPE
jgi:hypothetical protein